MRRRELRDACEHLRERIDVARRRAAGAFEHRVAGDLAHHLLRFDDAERREPERDVLQDLHEDPAEPEHDDRTESRVAAHADDRVDAVRSHRCDEHAVEPRVWSGSLRTLFERIESGPHRRAVLHVEHHAADLGLVLDVG
jgi:hypothetical protein